MLSEKMVTRLNEQINLEFYSSNLYLQMAAWCDYKGFNGCGKFLSGHAQEEMMHMQRLFTYVNECGAMAKLGTIEPKKLAVLRAQIRGDDQHRIRCIFHRCGCAKLHGCRIACGTQNWRQDAWA